MCVCGGHDNFDHVSFIKEEFTKIIELLEMTFQEKYIFNKRD